MASADTALLLARVPVFEELTEDDLRRVAEVSVPRAFAAGDVVFREGDDSDTCYVVQSGHARALREHPDGRQITLATFGPGDIFGELAMFDDERRSATVEAIDDLEVAGILGPDMRRLMREHPDGRQITLATFGPGDIFGELAMFDDERRSATVEAIDDLEVAGILGPDMRRLMREHPDIAVQLSIALGRRLRAANERLARQSFQTVQSRVALVLDQLVEQARSEGADDHDVLVRTTQADLAKLAGSSRESASRFLAVLERAGVITQGRGRLTVHDPAALQGYVY